MAARRQVRPARVKRELLPEQSPRLLQELHLLTREGQLNADALRKLKQVNHLVGLLRPALEDAFARHEQPVLVDAGGGNAYLGFILYELFFRERGRILSIDARPELTERVRARADRLGFERLEPITASLEAAPFPERIHLLTALHACDTATDDALIAALARRVDHVAVVPCCQAEVARQLQSHRAELSPTFAALAQHAWHRREIGSHLTNVIRALTLESHGYQVTVTELTGWEHSLKNELILGRKVHRESVPAREKLEALLREARVSPKLTRVLGWASDGE